MKSFISKYKYILFFMIALLLEVFIFNFRFFQSMNYKETPLINPKFSETIEYDPRTKCMKTEEDGDKILSYSNINKEIHNIYIDMNRDNPENIAELNALRIAVKTSDAANDSPIWLPKRDIVVNSERSKYMFLNLAGETDELNIYFDSYGYDVYLNKIVINKKMPMFFNIFRVFTVFALFSVACLLRSTSWIWNVKFKKNSIKQLIALFGVGLANIILIFVFVFANPYYLNNEGIAHQQYYKLAEAFSHGRLYLEDEPSKELIALDNPYDPSARKSAKVKYNWDHAYRNGKYYVYFGAVPVLLMYLPFYLITGIHIGNEYVILITALFFLLFSFLLVREIVKRYFPNTSYVLYVIFSELLFLSSGTVFPIKRPDFYYVAIFVAVTLALCGIYFWISAKKDDGNFSKLRLFLGSLFIALIAGSRPQVLMAAFLSIPLFWDEVFKERKLFSKSSITETALFMFPFVAVATCVMWYNAARFGSPLDFGANYNLTTNDMTKRGFVLGRIPTGIFMYLFQPPVITPQFPFISKVSFYTDYMGRTIYEATYGGVFLCHIVLTSIFAAFGKLKNILKEKKLFYFVLSSLAFAVIIVIADTEMAGILQRYTLDFTWFLFLAAVICLFCIAEKFDNSVNYGYVCTMLAVLSVISLLYDASAFFFREKLAIESQNPTFFIEALYTVKFWL